MQPFSARQVNLLRQFILERVPADSTILTLPTGIVIMLKDSYTSWGTAVNLVKSVVEHFESTTTPPTLSEPGPEVLNFGRVTLEPDHTGKVVITISRK